VNWRFWQSSRDANLLKTERLRLLAITPQMMAAEQAQDGSLGRLLGARLTPEWPPEHWEPHVFEFIMKQIAEHPQAAGWNRYVLLPARNGERTSTLIGCVGGFVKPEGDVEIGYSTVPEFQRRGYATEAAQGLIAFLFARPEVRSVSAQTFPRLPESIKVMERCGMRFVGKGDEEGTVRYRRIR
jgi:ribosomal-protein-alanine N-acetyltransferase